MRQLITAFIIIANSLCLFAQSTSKITGQVMDSSGKPAAAATIVLVHATDSLPVKTTLADSAGRFTLQPVQPGTYKIWVTYLGYQRYGSNTITINPPGQDVDLLQIILQKSKGMQLKEVTITGKKPFVEHKIDRTVINVDALATNQGISALDVLEKSPGILIDPVTGAIGLEGKQGVTVYIDDKKSYLTGNDLLAYLQACRRARCNKLNL